MAGFYRPSFACNATDERRDEQEEEQAEKREKEEEGEVEQSVAYLWDRAGHAYLQPLRGCLCSQYFVILWSLTAPTVMCPGYATQTCSAL